MTTLLMALLGCGGGPEAVDPPRRPNVVLVTLDTTRADRIGAYGYAGARTDAIDALAASGRRYARAYSPIPLTIPAHAALLTGVWPARLGIRDNGGARLDESAVTLAEILRGRGYATAGSVAAFVTTREWGFSQGFDAYFDDISGSADSNFWHASRPGARVVDDALAWKREQAPGTPQFLWVHLYDPHFPYAPEPAWAEAQPERPYDAEIAYVDDQVARLVEAYRDTPTIFVIAADHGEGLGEHGELTHGLFVYEATQRVPLVISGPGVEPAVVESPVSLVDVLPTVLGLLGIDAPAGIDGLAVPGAAPRPLYMESYQLLQRFGMSPHRAVVDGADKLVATTRPELYDVAADPSEVTDRAAAEPDRVAALRAKLDAFGFPEPSGEAPLDPSIAGALEALGYVDGRFAGATDGPRPDPKDRKKVIVDSQRAERLQLEGRVADAEAILRELAAEEPEIIEFQSRRAAALARLGRSDEARAVVEAALVRDPDNLSLKGGLASHLATEGRFAEASALYQQVAEQMPYSPSFRALALRTLLSAPGARTEALVLGRRYVREHPDDAAVAGLLGVELAIGGSHDEALPLLKQGIRADRPERGVAHMLSGVALANGDVTLAKDLLDRELREWPANKNARATRLGVAAKEADWAGMVAVADAGLALAPKDVDLLHARAQALFNQKRFDDSRASLDQALAVDPGRSHLLLLDANLLSKEGKPDEGRARAAEANAALERERAAN